MHYAYSTMAMIRINEKTRDKLRKAGTKDETYDSIINRLLDGKKK
jgi:hypothetical protein